MTSSVKSNRVPHRAVYDAFTISEGNRKERDPFLIRPQTSNSTNSDGNGYEMMKKKSQNPKIPKTMSAWTEASLEASRKINETMSSTNSLPNPPSTEDYSISKSLIFSPPNCICDDDKTTAGTSWRDSGAPKKAAGDVSLSGKQLIPFLLKATTRLSPVKAEGVQIRLRQLTQMVNDNLLSDSCIQKLNFVVDALDRCDYDEAWKYYELMRSMFPLEMSSNWSHGLRLLIKELMPNQRSKRVGSAGGHVRYQ